VAHLYYPPVNFTLLIYSSADLHNQRETILNSRLLFPATAVIILLLIPFPSGHAQEETPAVAPAPASDTRTPSLQTRQQLEEIQKSIQEKRIQIEEMRKQLNREKDEIERRDLERRIEQEETSAISAFLSKTLPWVVLTSVCLIHNARMNNSTGRMSCSRFLNRCSRN
jgi:TolA-binding protein